jgi:hypothetical protein
MLNDDQTFLAARKFLESQIPYICDWPSPELSTYIVAAAVSLSRCKYQMSEPVWDVVQEGFFHFSHALTSRQKIMYLQAALDTGLVLGSGRNFDLLIAPVQDDVLASVIPERTEEVVGFLSILKRVDPKNTESLIIRVLSELDEQLTGVDLASLMTVPTAKKFLMLVGDGKHFKNLTRSRIQAVAGDN